METARVEKRPAEGPAPSWLARLARAALRLIGRRGPEPIREPAALARFLQTRSSYVAQMTLYGYLRTRAGVRFPELFDNDQFVVSINIAKWHVWLACLSDLSVYAGGMLRCSGATEEQTRNIVCGAVDRVLEETGVPSDAGPEFPAHAKRVRARLALCEWSAQGDYESAFTESPPALVEWAPIVDDLKALDAEIVRNSVRFRWNEIREQLGKALQGREIVEAWARTAPTPRTHAP